MPKIVLSERTEKGVHGGEERELTIFQTDFVPPVGFKWWFQDELYQVVDVQAHQKINEKYRLDFYEFYVEVLLERM